VAASTPCLTPGAQFHTHISPQRVTCTVDLPVPLGLDEEGAEVLEALIHNAMEIALAGYWPASESVRGPTDPLGVAEAD
jgi:hypothetical protein